MFASESLVNTCLLLLKKISPPSWWGHHSFFVCFCFPNTCYNVCTQNHWLPSLCLCFPEWIVIRASWMFSFTVDTDCLKTKQSHYHYLYHHSFQPLLIFCPSKKCYINWSGALTGPTLLWNVRSAPWSSFLSSVSLKPPSSYKVKQMRKTIMNSFFS